MALTEIPGLRQAENICIFLINSLLSDCTEYVENNCQNEYKYSAILPVCGIARNPVIALHCTRLTGHQDKTGTPTTVFYRMLLDAVLGYLEYF